MDTSRRAVSTSVSCWLAAIGAGAAEALVRTRLPDPPTAAQLAVRFTIYAVLVVLVASLLTGRNAVRWAVAVLLGGLGTVSLVAEPVGWLWTGGSPAAFLTNADGATWDLVGLRLFHLIAVLMAMVLMFSPAAGIFFHDARRAASVGLRRSDITSVRPAGSFEDRP